jgi:hypothetical protein
MSDQDIRPTQPQFAAGAYPTPQRPTYKPQTGNDGASGFGAGLLVALVFVVVAIMASMLNYN